MPSSRDHKQDGAAALGGDQSPYGGLIDRFWGLVDAANELGLDLAQNMGVHVTDSVAVVEIRRAEEQGEPITPARLAAKIHLTSGATSLLLNRLEEGGHVERRRGHADRRRVTLHLADAARAALEDFQEPVRTDFEEVLAKHSPEELELFASFVGELREVIDCHHRRHRR